jgi:7-cyano-7-deazaguanine synthase
VLLSGGLDSAVLLADEATRHRVLPLYVAVGFAWEQAERGMIARFLASDGINPRVGPLVGLTVDMHDVFPDSHWAMAGRPPGYHTPDEDVYLPGRNVVLLGKAAVYCAAAGVGRLLLGTLGHNPFPDATPRFRAAMSSALSLGLDHSIEIEAPYASMTKAEVVRRGAALDVPFELTMSCMNPRTRNGRPVERHPMPQEPLASLLQHCGMCSKCRERHDAFLEAGIPDPTDYADLSEVNLGK